MYIARKLFGALTVCGSLTSVFVRCPAHENSKLEILLVMNKQLLLVLQLYDFLMDTVASTTEAVNISWLDIISTQNNLLTTVSAGCVGCDRMCEPSAGRELHFPQGTRKRFGTIKRHRPPTGILFEYYALHVVMMIVDMSAPAHACYAA
jgi:hypothetical protein